MDLPLKYLDTGAMLAITNHWLHESTFGSVDEVKGLLPRVAEIHAELLASKPAEPTTTAPDLAALIQRLKDLDTRHDHALRAVYFLLLSAVSHARSLDPPDEATAAAFEAAGNRLFPKGLDGTRAGYLAEEGNAVRADESYRDDAKLRALVTGLMLHKKTSGANLWNHYLAMAHQVGEVEREKIAMKDGGESMPATLLKARNAWIDIVGTVVRVLGHAKSDAAKTILHGVVEPADKAARFAAASAARKAKTKDEDPTPNG